jgi:hypothetical protein
MPAYDGSFDGANTLTGETIWQDWLSLQNVFSRVQDKIRERRRMYRLDWTPADTNDVTSRRWKDYVIDPLPRNTIDFKADRLTMRPLLIRVPTEQFDVDAVSFMNDQGAFQGLGPDVDLMSLTRKIKDAEKDIAQRRADAIEKFLNGTLYINTVMRKEHLGLRWAMHLLVDGYGAYCAYYDETATDDEYPIILRALDPLSCVYRRGDQKTETFIHARQDTVFNLRREFGSSIFAGSTDFSIVYALDYWKRVKVRRADPVTGERKYYPEVWHATYLVNAGLSGDAYSQVIPSSNYTKATANGTGWALRPTKTDYVEIPCDVIEARVTPLTENGEEMVASDLDTVKEMWNAHNYFLTRIHKQSKLGAGADLVTKGIGGEALQKIGRGDGITVSIPSDSQLRPEEATSWTKPPPYDPQGAQFETTLTSMMQQSLMPLTSLGLRGGTVSGAQVNDLDQGASVKLQTFVNALNLVHTSWARTVMMIANVYFKDTDKSISVYGVDKNSAPFVQKISSTDISGDYTVFCDVNPKTSMEQLQEALTAIRLASPDPGAAILSKQSIREQFLQTQYNWQEENRIKREAIEMNAEIVKRQSQQMITQANIQMLGNLESIRVNSILKGVQPPPMLMQMMQQIQNDLLQGSADFEGGEADTGQQQPGNRLILPTNEGQAGPPGMDQRSYPPTSPAEASFAMNGQAARNGMPVTRGQGGLG